MLRSLKDIERYQISATDGDIGSVANFLLDDERWTIRYLVAETGGFFDGRRALISPIFFRNVDWATRRFHVALTVDKIKNSPTIDTDKPVSRQHERDYYGYYGYPAYWGYEGVWGMGAYPGGLMAGTQTDLPATEPDSSNNSHLRSVAELRGYHIQGSDEAIGHVADFIIDDESWEVRYLVIDTNNWWFGKKVLVAPHWVDRVSWAERTVYVDMTREAIKNSPRCDLHAPINREYEARLYDYYGRPIYWDSSRTSAGAAPGHT